MFYSLPNTQIRPAFDQSTDAAYYESVYSRCAKSGEYNFSGPPDRAVRFAAENLKPGKALDLGCGTGDNTIYLAQKGFEVEAIDFAPTVVNQINRKAATASLPMKAFTLNVLHTLFCPDQQLIVCSYVLDHFSTENAFTLVRRMCENTAIGGMNVIVTYEKVSEFLVGGRDHHFFSENELRNLYKGWEVVLAELGTDKHEYDPPQPVIDFVVKRVR